MNKAISISARHSPLRLGHGPFATRFEMKLICVAETTVFCILRMILISPIRSCTPSVSSQSQTWSALRPRIVTTRKIHPVKTTTMNIKRVYAGSSLSSWSGHTLIMVAQGKDRIGAQEWTYREIVPQPLTFSPSISRSSGGGDKFSDAPEFCSSRGCSPCILDRGWTTINAVLACERCSNMRQS